MNEAQIEKIVTAVLRERLSDNGFSKSDIVFDEDFDGEKVIRVTAHFEKPVENADEFSETIDAIRVKLLNLGDERFVFLSQDYPGSEDESQVDDDDFGKAHTP